MNLIDILTGTTGKMITYTNVIIILILMLVVTLRLLLNRKKKAYKSIALSLAFLIVQYSISLAWLLSEDGRTLTNEYWLLSLQVIAFLIINRGLYQLYNRSRLKDMILFYSLLFITVIISFTFYPGAPWITISENDPIMQYVVLDIFMTVLISLGFFLMPRWIGQIGKYRTGLIAFLLFQGAGMMERYTFDHLITTLVIIENVMPILFYAILFLFLFERVVEIMHAVYRSSIKDGLTDVYNRNYFFNMVKQFVSRKMKVSVLFTDIDNFKRLNDTQGHHKGDQVLKQVAAILREESEDIGIAARYGGEELVMLITDPAVKMKELAERVRSRVMDETCVTVSVGYSTSKKDITDAHKLIRQADEAMYISKTTGKNKVTRYRKS